MTIDKYWPRQPSTLNGSNTCVGSRVDSSNVDTSVVSATTSPTPKLEWGKNIKRKWAELYQCIFLVPFVDDVKALYRLFWILAIVGSQYFSSNASA